MNFSHLTNSWISLVIAIVFGVLGTICLKLSHGLNKSKAAFYLAIFYTISFIALTFAMKHLPLSLVYAVWSGVGTILVTTVSVFYFKESMSYKKFFFLILIIIGVIGIHLSDCIS